MKVPSEAVDDARPLAYQILAMSNQHPDFAVGAVEACCGELRFAKSGSSHSKSINRV